MPPRVMILGLDGATFHFIEPMVAQGRLPTLAGLMQRGAHGRLQSIYPPHTAAAWSTVMTGMLPGNHGTFNFYELDLNKYSRRGAPTTSDTKRGKTIFDIAGKAGMKVASIHVPMTFPAWPVNGMMFSGYPAPAGSPAVAYPRELAVRFGDLTANTWTRAPERRLAWSRNHIERQTEVCEAVLTEYEPDLFMTVFMESDWAHHYFMRYHDWRSPAFTNADYQKYGDYIDLMYEALDKGLARLLKHAGPETTVIVVSDHGGTVSAPNAFHLNGWLAQQGLLTPAGSNAAQFGYTVLRRVTKTLKKFPVREMKEQRWARYVMPVVSGPLSLASKMGLGGMMDRVYEVNDSGVQIDPAHTKAYRFQIVTQAEGVALNVAGRQPEGIVQPGEEYEALREKIIAGLKELRTPDTDEPLFLGVYRREEIFPGKYTEAVPDIITRLHPMYRVGTNPTPPLFTKLTAADVAGPLSGWHDDYGILIAAGPDITAGAEVEGAMLVNTAPTVLQALGLAAPDWMEGAVQPGVFAGVSERELVTVTAGGADGSTFGDGDEYSISADEEESIKERLQNLGYL